MPGANGSRHYQAKMRPGRGERVENGTLTIFVIYVGSDRQRLPSCLPSYSVSFMIGKVAKLRDGISLLMQPPYIDLVSLP